MNVIKLKISVNEVFESSKLLDEENNEAFVGGLFKHQDAKAFILKILKDGPAFEIIVSGASMLIFGESALMLKVFDFECAKLDEILLNRSEKDDEDYWRQFVFETDDHEFLFVYEGGLVKLTKELKLNWKIDHQRIDWFFKKVEGGMIYYESEHEGCWSYCLKDGRKIANGNNEHGE